MRKAFDVVVVPDFQCHEAATFEARTLFFLVSWIENAGRGRHFPLHLACIGDPPSSVCRLAEKANAVISVHQPVGAEGWGASNKLRGLEISGQEDRVLMLDADIVVLSDLSELADTDVCIAASPDTTQQIPEPYWQRIYGGLGMDLPEHRMLCLRDELAGKPSFGPIFPYYNSGVVFLPWRCDLRTLWEDHIRRITGLFSEKDEIWQAVAYSDQAGLATSIESLRRRGIPFARLPDTFNANWLHLYWQPLKLREIKLFHCFGLFRNMVRGLEHVDHELTRYFIKLIQRLVDECKRDDLSGRARRLLPAAGKAFSLSRVLRQLYGRGVSATVGRAGPKIAQSGV